MPQSDRMLLIELASSVKELAEAVKGLRESQTAIGERLTEIEERLERGEAAAQDRARTGYAQIEDLIGLYRDIDPDGALPRMRGWAAGPELLRFLYETTIEDRRSRVLECGSGATTVVMAYAMRSLGSGKVTALEHHRHYADRTRRELEGRGLTEWAEVVDAELTEVTIEDETWRWYDPAAVPPGRIDMLVVDGPPGATGPQARYPALPLLAERLTEHASIVLDDADRADERTIERRWIERFPWFSSERLKHERGTVVLRRAEEL